MRLRPEIARTILRVASGAPLSPHGVVAEIERMARDNGIDEMKLARAVGSFWGRYFRELEALEAGR